MEQIYKIVESAEILYGSFEIEENINLAKQSGGIFDTLINEIISLYLESFTAEERAERKRTASIRPVGVIRYGVSTSQA